MYYNNFTALAALLAACLTLTTPVLAHDKPHGQNKNNQSKGSSGGKSQGAHKHYEFRIETSLRLPEFWVPSANRKVQNVLNLIHKPGQKPHNAAYMQALRGGHQVDGVYGVEEVDITDTGMICHTSGRILNPSIPRRPK